MAVALVLLLLFTELDDDDDDDDEEAFVNEVVPLALLFVLLMLALLK